LPPLTIDRLAALLAQYAQKTGRTVDILLVEGLALQAYGLAERATMDVDGEVSGDLEPFVQFLKQHGIPADLGENMSRLSVVAMPPGYRERATVAKDEAGVRLRLLAPADFIAAKLRRGTDLDMEDAGYVARRFQITAGQIRVAAESAISVSPKDTALFVFRKTVDLFCASISS
jgi:hypothetical protein